MTHVEHLDPYAKHLRVRRNIDHERRNGVPSAFSYTIVIRGETTDESRAIDSGVGRMVTKLIKTCAHLFPFADAVS